MVEGRSKQVFKSWLGERDTSWGDGVEVVAMDGFTGSKTATCEELPDAVAVMDPFHVVRLAGDALDQCRRRVQQATCGHRGRKGDPLSAARGTLHTGSDLLTDLLVRRPRSVLDPPRLPQVPAGAPARAASSTAPGSCGRPPPTRRRRTPPEALALYQGYERTLYAVL